MLLLPYLRNHCSTQYHGYLLLYFLFKIFIISVLIFRFMIYFELLYGVMMEGSSFMLLQVDIYLSLHHLLKILFLLKKFLLLFNYSCSHFPPFLYPALPTPLSHIQSSSPVVFLHGSFIHVPWLDPSPSFPRYPSPRPSPLVTVSLFFICMSLVLFLLLVLLARFYL